MFIFSNSLFDGLSWGSSAIECAMRWYRAALCSALAALWLLPLVTCEG